MSHRYFRILPCPDYHAINKDLFDYVKSHTTILEPSENYQYANFPERFGHDVLHFVKHNPKFVAWLQDLNMKLKDLYFTLAWSSRSMVSDESSCPIHLDKPPVAWKLNWPILNMERSAVRFFHANDPGIDINSLVTRHGQADSKDRDEYHLQYADFHEVERHDFSQNEPIIMNGQIPHDVGFYPDSVFPRIGIQAMFYKEPTHLL